MIAGSIPDLEENLSECAIGIISTIFFKGLSQSRAMQQPPTDVFATFFSHATTITN